MLAERLTKLGDFLSKFVFTQQAKLKREHAIVCRRKMPGKQKCPPDNITSYINI